MVTMKESDSQIEGYTGGISVKTWEKREREKAVKVKAAGGKNVATPELVPPQQLDHQSSLALQASTHAADEPKSIRDLQEAVACYQQESDEVRQWRQSLWQQARNAERESCIEAVERYTENARLLKHVFTPPPCGRDPVDHLTNNTLLRLLTSHLVEGEGLLLGSSGRALTEPRDGYRRLASPSSLPAQEKAASSGRGSAEEHVKGRSKGAEGGGGKNDPLARGEGGSSAKGVGAKGGGKESTDVPSKSIEPLYSTRLAAPDELGSYDLCAPPTKRFCHRIEGPLTKQELEVLAKLPYGDVNLTLQ
eukprot:gene20583-27380_t